MAAWHGNENIYKIIYIWEWSYTNWGHYHAHDSIYNYMFNIPREQNNSEYLTEMWNFHQAALIVKWWSVHLENEQGDYAEFEATDSGTVASALSS